MPRATHLRLEPGERRVLVVRRHRWLMIRPLLALLPLLAALPLYATVEYLAPQADLASYASLFVTVDLLLCAVLVLKWLAVDLVAWYADSYVVTNRRVIEQRGLVVVERREASLRTVQESNYSISGAEARLFNYGDLEVQTGGRAAPIVFRRVPHPRRLQGLLAAQARAAREEHQRDGAGEGGAINAALARIFGTDTPAHDAPTIAVPRVTPAALHARRRLSLLPDEAILYSTRRHPLILLLALLPPLALAGAATSALVLLAPPLPGAIPLCLAAVVALWALWAVLAWRDTLYVLTSERIVELRRSPLFFEMRAVVQVRAVRDVVLRISSLSGRLFNLGTLTIDAGAAPLRLSAVPHPDRLQRLIFEGIDEALQRDRLREQERLAGTLGEWFKEYHRMQGGP